MNEWKRPLPAIPGETMPFWNGCREGKLLLQQDQATGGFQWYPRSINTMTPGGKMNWVASSGKGTVWTFTITRQNRTPLLTQSIELFPSKVIGDVYQQKMIFCIHSQSTSSTNKPTDKGAALIWSSSIFSRAVVTNNLFRFLPPNAMLVTMGTGISIT